MLSYEVLRVFMEINGKLPVPSPHGNVIVTHNWKRTPLWRIETIVASPATLQKREKDEMAQ